MQRDLVKKLRARARSILRKNAELFISRTKGLLGPLPPEAAFFAWTKVTWESDTISLCIELFAENRILILINPGGVL